MLKYKQYSLKYGGKMRVNVKQTDSIERRNKKKSNIVIHNIHIMLVMKPHDFTKVK